MKNLAIAGGVIVLVLIGVFVAVKFLAAGDADTALELSGTGAACAIVTPAQSKDVTVQKNKKVTWHVTNHCDTQQTVTLGNFRTVQTGSASNCTNDTEGGADWPFKDQDKGNRSVTVAATTGKDDIVLKEAKNAGSASVTYYFDICLGLVKKDPRLIIDP